MNPFKVLVTPEYLFRPSQIVTRLRRGSPNRAPERGAVRLPWGDVIPVRPRETIGSELWYYGIFDLVVAEALVRLVDRGDFGLDIGANIGQMTSLLSVLVGKEGRVAAFEPHPELFGELQGFVKKGLNGSGASIDLRQLALSRESGRGLLELPVHWDCNRGVGRLAESSEQYRENGSRTVPVELAALDDVIGPDEMVGICKIDVEGHELSVFQGAQRLLSRRRIRDIVFEDFRGYPSPVHRFLENNGYSLFALHAGSLRPKLSAVGRGAPTFGAREGCNFLATCEPARARSRFSGFGWKTFSVRRS